MKPIILRKKINNYINFKKGCIHAYLPDLYGIKHCVPRGLFGLNVRSTAMVILGLGTGRSHRNSSYPPQRVSRVGYK